jgi:hypothetical protein
MAVPQQGVHLWLEKIKDFVAVIGGRKRVTTDQKIESNDSTEAALQRRRRADETHEEKRHIVTSLLSSASKITRLERDSPSRYKSLLSCSLKLFNQSETLYRSENGC